MLSRANRYGQKLRNHPASPGVPLSDRIARERASHESGKVHTNSAAIHRRFRHLLGNPNALYGKKHFKEYIDRISPEALTLEIGCGEGLDLLQRRPFKLTAIDLSFRSLRGAQENYGAGAAVLQMDAHRTGFRDGSFDVVVGQSILHHLEYERALQEVYRILKVGGIAIFAEPLLDNPAAKLWRALTPEARTIDERPLSRAQIIRGDALFGSHDHRFINLVSTPVSMLTSFIFRQPDNALLLLAHRIDLMLERTAARYWMRTAYLVWKK
ncbi:MAG: class I SAM-dependent methyltransferase [Candidatus Binataceae bacterium]|jgi:SAM-dependent methyltransferase